MIRIIRLIVCYDGTFYSGYELQPGKKSIREEIETALFNLFKKKISINAVSRTDAKVHAIYQIVQFSLSHPIATLKIPYILNTFLPDDIKILKAYEIEDDKKVRFSVDNKEYQYLIYNEQIIQPFFRNFTWHIKKRLDISSMKKAIKYFKGTHDFSSFCASRSFLHLRKLKTKETKKDEFVRTIYKASISIKKINLWDGCESTVVSMKFKGDGFLYKMIRNMVGTLVEVGLNKKKPQDIKGILSKKQRKFAGRCAPPQGLCLINVK